LDFEGGIEDDITDDIYCLQEDKLHTEEDNKKNLAERKKQKTLGIIRQLQERYRELKEKNASYDPSFRLSGEELQVDEEYDKILQSRVDHLLEETTKELEWDKKYAELKRDKLKNYFIDELQCPKFTLKAFKSPNSVTTFRVKKLSEYAEKHLDEINRILEEEFQAQAEEEANKTNADTRLFDDSKLGNSSMLMKKNLSMKQSKLDDANATVSSKQAFEKKKMRSTMPEKKPYEKYDREKAKKEAEERQAELAELERNRPTKDAFKPEIDEEIMRFGDKKLKSSPDYIVPEDQRMNVGKKRKHMFLLYEILYNSKKEFNDKLVNLRRNKMEIIEKINKYNARLKEIDAELEVTQEYYTPTLDEAVEYPEKAYEISDEQVTEYAKKKEEERLAQQQKGAFFGSVPQQTNPTTKTEPQNTVAPQVNQGKVIIQTKDRKNKKFVPSKLEEELIAVQKIRLESEKKDLLEQINKDIEEFDKQIARLQLDKAFLESNMKVVEMKLITSFQELIILNDMEDHDNMLINQLLEARKEKNHYEAQNTEIAKQIFNNGEKALGVERELGEVTNKYNQYFMDDINKANKIFAFYQKFHRRRIEKENKKRNEGDEDEADDDGDDDLDFDDDDDDEEKPDISPVESDPDLKKLVERRNELEDTKAALIKEKESLETQRRITNTKLNQIGDKISKVI